MHDVANREGLLLSAHFVYSLLALGSIHSPKNTIGLTGSSVIRILVAPAGMVNPSW